MKRNIILAPSILSADFSNIGKAVKQVEKGGAGWLHIDVMDGVFVPNITFGQKLVKDIRKITDLIFDTHLMIIEPDRYIRDFAEAGSDYITFHLEASIHAHRTVSHIHSYGKKAGISIVPSTSVTLVEPILPFVDMVLIMSVNPGFGGQKMIKEVLSKVNWLKEKRAELNLDYLIEIDGGINKKTVKYAIDSGTDVIVAGSAIFKSNDPVNEIRGMIKSFQNDV